MSAPFDTNIYVAEILRHIDADTTYIRISHGFDTFINLTARWHGINAPERGTPEGVRALEVVNEWLPVGSKCLVMSYKEKREKFGRYLITFYTTDMQNLNEKLVEEGHAVPYMV